MRRIVGVLLVVLLVFCCVAGASNWRAWINGHEVQQFTVTQNADGTIFIDLSVAGIGTVTILTQAFADLEAQQLVFQDGFTISADYLSLSQFLTIENGVLTLNRDALIANGFAVGLTQAPDGTDITLAFVGSGLLSEGIRTDVVARLVRLTLELDGRFLVNERDSNPREIMPKGILKLVTQTISEGIFTMTVENVGDATIGLGEAEITLGFVVDPSWRPDPMTTWAKLRMKDVILHPGEKKDFNFSLPQMPAKAMKSFHSWIKRMYPRYEEHDPQPDTPCTVEQNGLQFRCVQHYDWVSVVMKVRSLDGKSSGEIKTYIPCFLKEVLGF